MEKLAVSDVVGVVVVVVVVVTGLDMLLSIEVDVSVSVFVEDDTEVPSELDVVLFAVVDISIVVVLVCIFVFVVVSDVSVEMVCVVVVVVVVSAPVVFVLETDELSSVVKAFSVVDSDSGVGVVTVVDEFVDTSPAKVVMLIIEVSSVIVFPALVVRESLLLVLVVFKIGGTLSVVEVSCVLF